MRVNNLCGSLPGSQLVKDRLGSDASPGHEGFGHNHRLTFAERIVPSVILLQAGRWYWAPGRSVSVPFERNQPA